MLSRSQISYMLHACQETEGIYMIITNLGTELTDAFFYLYWTPENDMSMTFLVSVVSVKYTPPI
jgi:hypothetical protein